MPRKKKAEPLIGMSRDPESKLTVQKSRPLTALWQSELSLAEFKILDAYLARINSKNPDQRSVVLPKGELERALGVTRINREDLNQRLSHLSKPIDLAKGNKKKIHLLGLFEEAEAEQDENGIWQIKLTCTQSAMKYFFNVEKLGYFRYKLRCITSMTSRYTYILFTYLESNRFRESWEVNLDELKELLNCHEDELYKEFKMFNQRILKRCQKELAEKTECRFTYEPIRKGRSVSSIRFTLELLSPSIEAEIKTPGQMTVFDLGIEDELQEKRDLRAEKVGCGFDDEIFDEFTVEELIEFRGMIWPLVDAEEVEKHAVMLKDRRAAYEYAAATYLAKKIKTMNVYDSRNPITNRYTYLKKSLANEE